MRHPHKNLDKGGYRSARYACWAMCTGLRLKSRKYCETNTPSPIAFRTEDCGLMTLPENCSPLPRPYNIRSCAACVATAIRASTLWESDRPVDPQTVVKSPLAGAARVARVMRRPLATAGCIKRSSAQRGPDSCPRPPRSLLALPFLPPTPSRDSTVLLPPAATALGGFLRYQV